MFYLWGIFLCNTFSSWWLGVPLGFLGCRQGSAGFQWLEGFWLFPKGRCKSVTFPWPFQCDHGQVTSLPGHLGPTLGAKGVTTVLAEVPRALLSLPIPHLAEDIRQPLCHPALQWETEAGRGAVGPGTAPC